MPIHNRYFLEIGYACNNKCIWCFNILDKGIGTFGQIKGYIDKNIPRGSYVCISGGEPTIHPDFIRIMDYVNKTGAQISLFTNARKFKDMDFALAAVKHASELACTVALHGNTPEIHDRITQVAGSFEETMTGIRNLFQLKSRGFPVNIYLKILIPKINIGHLPETVRWICNEFPDSQHLIIQAMDIVRRGLEHEDKLLIKLVDAVPYLVEAVKIGNYFGRKIGLIYIPPCIFPDPEFYSSFTMPIDIQDVNVYKPLLCQETINDAARAAKAPQCKQCEADEFCDGIWSSYAQIAGFDELKPIKTLKTPLWLRAGNKIIM